MGDCKCGCGNEAKIGDFIPGHDQKLRSTLEQKVGGLLFLKQLLASCEEYAAGKASEADVLRTIRQVFSR